jgi:hypothetical protein
VLFCYRTLAVGKHLNKGTELNYYVAWRILGNMEQETKLHARKVKQPEAWLYEYIFSGSIQYSYMDMLSMQVTAHIN